MTYVPKEMWPKGMVESKNVADHVLQLNRKLEKFRKADKEEVPSDRELALSAGINIFWAYKVSQEAGASARRITLEKVKEFLEKEINEAPPHQDQMPARRLVKAVKRTMAGTEGNNFLEMWLRVERWLVVASRPEYWKQFEEPSTVIRALIADLESVANQGESNGKEEGSSSETGSTEGTPGTEGGSDQADRPAVPSADGLGGEPKQGEDGPAEGVRGGGEGMEETPRRVQEQNQEPTGAGGQAPIGSESQGSDGNSNCNAGS